MNSQRENLVFFPDSPFADWIIERCECLFPGVNEYYTFGKSPKKITSKLVYSIGFEEEELKKFALKIPGFQRVIIHYHHELTAYLIEKARVPSSKIIWVLWSGDLYNSPFYKKSIYLPKTGKSTSIPKIPELGLAEKLKEKVKQAFGKPSFFTYQSSYSRFQHVASFFPGDVANARETFDKNYTHLPHAILSIKEQIHQWDSDELPQLGSGILLGHAGVPELNHLDILEDYSFYFTGKTVICPLSYGNSEYIREVKELGLKKLGSAFQPMEEYMPREEYFTFLKKCSFAIFGSIIHQGFGNIMTLLYLGFKIFMLEENPIYKQLTFLGLKLFPLEDAKSMNFEESLSTNDILHNRKILDQILGEEQVKSYYKSLYQAQL